MRLTLIALAVKALCEMSAANSRPVLFYRCSHCRKNDHSDAECWSTRAVPYFAQRA